MHLHLFLKESSALLAKGDKNLKMRLPFGKAVTWGYQPKGLRSKPEMKLFIGNNQIYLIMQNTSNDTKHRYELILCSILIPEYDFHFNFNSS